MQKIPLKISLFLSLFLLYHCNENKIIDWSESFDSKQKIPFGTYILKEELSKLFPKNEIKIINKNTLEYLKNSESNELEYEENEYSTYGNYIYINTKLLQDSLTQKELYRFCYDGNVAFISSYEIPKYFPGLGHLELVMPFKNDSLYGREKIGNKKKVQFSVENNFLPNDTLSFGGLVQANYYKNINADITILGYSYFNGNKKPNFIQIPVGKGALILHTEPFAFTNFELLRSHHFKYAERCLSFLNNNPIHWDNERMISRYLYGSNQGGFFNYIKFAWQHPPLRYAILIVVMAIFLFLVFNSSRRQRALPYLVPYKNESLLFAQTMAKLYSNSTHYDTLTADKINYFLDEVRTKYYLSGNLDEHFITQLSRKTQTDEAFCGKLINYMITLNNKNHHSKTEFLQLSKMIDNFNKNIKK